MEILFLGPEDSPVLAHLRELGEDVRQTMERVADEAPDFLVSHGYRHVLPPDVVARFRGRAVNLHIAYLPWNRGADPNFWSFVEGTPKGVTIHWIDEGVDTGDVIAQREVALGEDETLRSSYAKLQAALLDLFREHWPAIRAGTCGGRPQEGEGTTHRVRDREPYEHLLAEGWDTPVSALRGARRASPR